jgi:hypothetical protein
MSRSSNFWVDPVQVAVQLEHGAIGLADHGCCARRAVAGQLARHDQAGRDAGPPRQRRARR